MNRTVIWRDQIWHDDLLARIYEPPVETRTLRRGAAVVDVHGGAWSRMDRTLGERYCNAAAAAGFVVVAIDFRDGRVARHPAAVLDVAEAVRWVRRQASQLEVDPQRVALMGSSSGGHLALHAALTEVDVPFVAAFWPPVDPLGRYRYAHSQIDQPVPASVTAPTMGPSGSRTLSSRNSSLRSASTEAWGVWPVHTIRSKSETQSHASASIRQAMLAALTTRSGLLGGVLVLTCEDH